MKSTQCGISEFLIVYTIDEALQGRSVFYVLPTDMLKNRFVRNRLDKSIILSPYYRKIVYQDDDKKKKSESMSLKDIGGGVVALAGSNTPVPFTEYPADTYIVDEKDRCNQEHLLMGEERLSHSDHKRRVDVSNPTIEGFGIHNDMQDSDYKKWWIPCSNCGEWIQPDFFTHVVQQVDAADWLVLDKDWDTNSEFDINPICDNCNRPFDRFIQGEWIDTMNGKLSGYHISKMFSTNNTIAELVKRFEKGLVNDTAMERFWNGDLGLAYSSEGAKITESLLNKCKDNYNLPPDGIPDDIGKSDTVIMGVDVGLKLHVRIDKLLSDGNMKAVYIGAVDEYEDLKRLHQTFKVSLGVIDAQPERRLSKKVVSTMKGMFMCFYGEVKRDIIDPLYRMITVDRTSTLDLVKEAMITGQKILPMNAGSIHEYYEHMTASTRIYDEAKEKYSWVKVSNDHYHHAEAYTMVAKKLIVRLMNR